jgi:hypothetical protein
MKTPKYIYQVYADRGNGPELDGSWSSEHAFFNTEEEAEQAIEQLKEGYPDVKWLWKAEERFAITDSEGNPMGYGSSEEQAIQDAAEALDITTEKVEELLALRNSPECFCWADDRWFESWLASDKKLFENFEAQIA